MRHFLKPVRRFVRRMRAGDGSSAARKPTYPPDFTPLSKGICARVAPFTMTSPERVNALVEAVRYVAANGVDGAMVECGVWKGGSTMAMALTLMDLGDETREIYLYDTFSGMSEPSEADVSIGGDDAREIFDEFKLSDATSDWCRSPLEEVKANVVSTGYPSEKLHFIVGKVEETIPGRVPARIALLRLDTDWYESTKHELHHLFPLIVPNGVILIDDYGHWEGARKAVDEYVSEHGIRLLLNRIDYSGRIGIKTV